MMPWDTAAILWYGVRSEVHIKYREGKEEEPDFLKKALIKTTVLD